MSRIICQICWRCSSTAFCGCASDRFFTTENHDDECFSPPEKFSSRPRPGAASRQMGSIVALGIVYLIVRFIALGGVAVPTAASILIAGTTMIVAAVAEVISAFPGRELGTLPASKSCFNLNRALFRLRSG